VALKIEESTDEKVTCKDLVGDQYMQKLEQRAKELKKE
jgi:hypothetical protein